MIDFDYAAPETWRSRISSLQMRAEPHKVGGVVYVPESGTCENVAREWEKTSFAHACTSFCCSECGAHYVDGECYYAGLADKDEEQIRTNFCPNCGRSVKR